jgi:hypothetical protein
VLVKLDDLQSICGTDEEAVMAWSEMHYKVSDTSLKKLTWPTDFELCGLSYKPSTFHFHNSKGHTLFPKTHHADVLLEGKLTTRGRY